MLFIFEMFRRRRQSAPVVEQPPALLEPKLPEEKLRAMYRIGFTAGLKQAKEEEEQANRAQISSLKTWKPKPAQPVISMPVQAVSQPQQTPLQFPGRAGGWMHTERARQRVAAKLKQQILPVRPKPYNIPTVAELPIVRRHFPDAG